MKKEELEILKKQAASGNTNAQFILWSLSDEGKKRRAASMDKLRKELEDMRNA